MEWEYVYGRHLDFTSHYGIIKIDDGYVPYVVITSWSLFIRDLFKRMSLVNQQLLTLPVFIGFRFARSLRFYVVFCRLLFSLLSFYLGHSIVCPSYDFGLLFWNRSSNLSWNEQSTDINCLRVKQDIIKFITFSYNLNAIWIIAMEWSIFIASFLSNM